MIIYATYNYYICVNNNNYVNDFDLINRLSRNN